MRSTLEQLVGGENLSRERARAAMQSIMNGDATAAQIAGFLVALRIKGETVEEITGFAEAMRSVANRLDLGRDGLVDTCGTGGDGAGTFNVSTAAALVTAACGVPVAKHGNRSVSSACGSADVLEELGVTLVSSEAALRRSLQQAGIAFLFAPAQHPAMRHAIGPRRELALRTVFNVLGPLTNPAGARRQVLGVYAESLVEPLAQVLGSLGAEHAMVVHGDGGLDELGLSGRSRVAEWDGERVFCYALEAADLGLAPAPPQALAGGSVARNASIVRSVLAGDPGPAQDVVVLNAAAAVYVGGTASSIQQGVELAHEAITSGAAAATLARLVAATAEGVDS